MTHMYMLVTWSPVPQLTARPCLQGQRVQNATPTRCRILELIGTETQGKVISITDGCSRTTADLMSFLSKGPNFFLVPPDFLASTTGRTFDQSTMSGIWRKKTWQNCFVARTVQIWPSLKFWRRCTSLRISEIFTRLRASHGHEIATMFNSSPFRMQL